MDTPDNTLSNPQLPSPFSSRVYFLRIGSYGPIKIGVSNSPLGRCNTLQTGIPWHVRIIATIPGDAPLESSLHAQFAHLSLRGEWFRPAPDLLAYIQSHATPYIESSPAEAEEVIRDARTKYGGWRKLRVKNIGSKKASSPPPSIDTVMEEIIRAAKAAGMSLEQLEEQSRRCWDETAEISAHAFEFVGRCLKADMTEEEIVEEIWRAIIETQSTE